MIKNKDGSYNVISLGILAAIAIIGIVMMASVLITDKPDIDFGTAITYSGMITCILLIFYFGNRILSRSKSSTPSSIPIKTESIKPTNPVTVTEPIEIKFDKEVAQREWRKHNEIEVPTPVTKSSISPFGLVNGIIAMVIGAVLLMVGLGVVNSIQASMPAIQENTPMSTAMNNVTNTIGTAFNLMGILIFIFAAMMIIGMVAGIARSD